jgi:hypothetical protein
LVEFVLTYPPSSIKPLTISSPVSPVPPRTKTLSFAAMMVATKMYDGWYSMPVLHVALCEAISLLERAGANASDHMA